MAGQFVARLTGHGEYHVERNTLMNPQGVPQFKQTKDSIRITHKEMFKVVDGSVDFTNTVFDVNPGNKKMFPWLSSVADSYSTYRFNGLVVAYKSTSADAVGSPDTALGRVCMASMYDVMQAPFISMVAMEAHEYSNSNKPAEDSVHGIECAKNELVLKDLYVTSPDFAFSDLSAGDERFHNMAKFQFATEGMQQVSQIGELWVTYDVTLLVNREPINTYAFSHYEMQGMDFANPLGSVITKRLGGTASVTVDGGVVDGNLIFHEVGDYQLQVFIDATIGNTVSTFNLLFHSGSWTPGGGLYWASSPNFYTLAGVGTREADVIYAFRINKPDTKLTWSYAQSAGLGVADMQFLKLPNGSVAPPLTFSSLVADEKDPKPHAVTWKSEPSRTIRVPKQREELKIEIPDIEECHEALTKPDTPRPNTPAVSAHRNANAGGVGQWILAATQRQ